MAHGSIKHLALVAAIGIAVTASPANAQQAAAGNGREDPLNRPVALDPGIADAGPLATSLRVIDQGISVFSHRAAITAVRDPANPHAALQRPYEFRSPGFRALMRSVDTVVRNREGQIALNQAPGRDGQFLRTIPADTVFSLTPDAAVPQAPPEQAPPTYLDRRLDHRVDYRVQAQVPSMLSSRQPRPALLPDRHIPRARPAATQPATQPAAEPAPTQ